jgi:hypothetical protein
MEQSEIVELRQAVATLSGRLTAYEYALKLLLFTHQDREWVKKIWRNLLPENVDRWMENPFYASNASVRDSIHSNLAELHKFLEFEAPETDDDE